MCIAYVMSPLHLQLRSAAAAAQLWRSLVNMSRLQVTQFVADLSESDSALTIHNSKHSFANSVVQTAMQITVTGLLRCHLAFQRVPTLQRTIYTQYKGHREHIVWVNNPATTPCLAEKSQKIANRTILRKGGFGCGSGRMFVTNWTNGNGIGTAVVTENR